MTASHLAWRVAGIATALAAALGLRWATAVEVRAAPADASLVRLSRGAPAQSSSNAVAGSRTRNWPSVRRTWLVQQADLRILEAKMLPFGRHFLLNHGVLGRLALSILKRLSQLPVLREVITTKMLFILRKQENKSSL